MKQEVTETVKKALEALRDELGLEEVPEAELEIPKNEAMGDFATTVAMRLARQSGKKPRDLAQKIVQTIQDQGSGIFDGIEVAGPGFINFRIRREVLYRSLGQLLTEGHSLLRSDIGKGHRVQVEFVSANPTGPLHVGHGRGAAVGNALSNILKKAGYDVLKEFYVNDAGLQVRLLGQSVYARYQQLLGHDVPFPEDGYQGSYIEDVAKAIQKTAGDEYAGKTFNECAEFFTDFSYKMMLTDIARDLKDFGVVFDSWQSERELHGQGKVREALDALKQRQLLYEKDGAAWFASSRFEDDKDRVVIKQDGEYTYFASDIAYHKDKLARGFDTIIDIWGADHHGYIPRISSVLEAFDLPKDRFSVILIQMVSLLRHGRPVQMSKRAGTFVTLREVIDEVGADTTKFIFLTRRSDSHLDFDIDVAREQSSENPVFYVQYAFARISSIFRQAEERRVLSSEFGVKEAALSLLKEGEEISLIKKILQYPMVFEGAAISCEPHRITYYLQELAGAFHSYYYNHRVISDDAGLTRARLGLCMGVKIVLEEGLQILGVSAPERM